MSRFIASHQFRRAHRQRPRLELCRLELRAVPATLMGQTFFDYNGSGTVDAGDTGVSGVTVFLDPNNNGIVDNGPQKNYPSAIVPVAITATGTPTVTSALTVGDVGKISDINVRLDISHTYDSDLVVTLFGPSGASVILFSAVGGEADNFTSTVLDDQAATSITLAAAPFTGTFKPANPLSAFNNLATNGTWTLKIEDTANADGGSLNSWSLDITPAGDATTTTDATGKYSFTGLAAGSYNVAEVTPAGFVQTAPGGDGRHHFTVAAADTKTGDFGVRRTPAALYGKVFNDANGNGSIDVGDAGIAGAKVFLDTNNNGVLDNGPTVTFSFT